MFSFHHWFLLLFLGVFILDCICITVSSSVFISPMILLLLLECFLFTNFFYHNCFLSVTSLLCCCTASKRAIFTLMHFLPYTPFWHLTQPAFIKAALRLEVPPWRLYSLPLRFETQTRPICLNHTRFSERF